jgi:hypothetical protein
MKRAVSLAVIILLVLLEMFTQTVARPMTDNQKYLKEAQVRIKEFEAELEPERLRQAYMALENIILVQEHDNKSRTELRETVLSLWLQFLQILDRFLDSKFNPHDVPNKLIQPPPTTGGVVYPPGADPALIDDPQTRSEYEQAIAANRAKAEYYRLQINLRRLDEQITSRAEAFIRNSYTFTPSDREEAKAAILKTIKNPQRQERLLKACYEMD